MERNVHLVSVGSVAVGAGHIHDDVDVAVVAVDFAVDCGEGAEELLNDVGKDGCFLGGDTILGEENEEFG